MYGSKVDRKGNVYYNGTTRNFKPIIALAADFVIVEAMEIVEVGEIPPNDVMTPGVLIQAIVGGDQA